MEGVRLDVSVRRSGALYASQTSAV